MNKISAPKPAPIRRQPAESQATDSLREYVLDVEVAPGTALPEVELAGQLGVSRATLRTALHRLDSEGLIERHPYRGWSVVSLSAEEVLELWTIRRSLERMAAEILVERDDAEALARVGERFAELERACKLGDQEAINEADLAFHLSIVESANHRFLMHHYQQVVNQARRFIAATNQLPDFSPTEILAEHQELMDALLSGNSRVAGEAAWQHARPEGNTLLANMRLGDRDLTH